jgi:hypothetical protein
MMGLRKLEDRSGNPRSIYWFPTAFLIAVPIQPRGNALVKPPENQTSIDDRKGMPPRKLDGASFQERFLPAFIDPSFDQLRRELKAVADAAWDAYLNSQKSVDQEGGNLGHPARELQMRA